MRIVSYNVNGIRAAMKKGLLDWLKNDNPDLLCVQETKANSQDVDVSGFEELGYKHYWFSALKKGYSGVAIFSKQDAIITQGSGMMQSDEEGRVIRADIGDLTILNAYFPSGTSGDIRQNYKYTWLKDFQNHVVELLAKRKKLVVLGDYNIAHQEIDIHDPKGNKNSSGFLPEERAWMDQWLEAGFVDSFRFLHPTQVGAYSWWSQRFPSVRIQNKGWRIDYICTSKSLEKKIRAAGILPDARHSDHCPVFLELDR